MNISGVKLLRCKQREARGFSLVEILIVIVILGILAAIAVPKFSNASTISRENTIKEDLRLLRTQIGVYRTQHRDMNPGYPSGDANQTPTAATFIDQQTKYTDDLGNTSATLGTPYKWGPYLSKMPDNPISGLATIKILGPADDMVADGSTGWLYQPSTGSIEPNLTGVDSESHSYTSY